MAEITKIDSNVSGLRYCKEVSLGVLDGTVANQIWKPLEPNSYSDFGGKVTTVARNPINRNRQQKKGVVTDIEASLGITTDLTQTNAQDLSQGFFFASLRNKTQESATSATASTHKYHISTSALKVGSLINVTGATNAANNGLKHVTAVNSTDVTVTETLVDETATLTVVEVGFQFTANDATMFTGGSLPALKATTKNLTDLGLIPGEWVFIGGDTSPTSFATAADNGFARVRSVASGAITLDKTSGTIVADTGTGKTIQVFYGRVLKNETGTNIVRSSYHFERTLGASNDSDLTLEQADYNKGSVGDKWTLNIPTANKATLDMSFVAIRSFAIDENVSGANTLLSKAAAAAGSAGVNTPDIVEADAFNTSTDVSRIRLSVFTEGTTNPTPLFAFVQDLKITLDNKVTPDKAVGVTGAFDVTAGTFTVGGSITAYFADVAAVQAVQDNADITLDAHLVKANAGVSIDMPLITLGNGRPAVEQDKPVTLPLDNQAASGAKINSNLNHTLLVVFYDYLPTSAE